MILKLIRFLLFIHVLLVGKSLQDDASSQLFFIGPGVFKVDRTRTRANIVFLSQDGASFDGTLAGFASYVIQDAPVEFQIWRPVKTTFELVGTYPYKPPSGTTFPGYVDIYIKNLAQECIRIAKGDRVGIYFQSTVWPIPYAFIGDDSPEKQRSLVLDLEGRGNLTIGNKTTIDELIFPFQFSMAAWVLNYSTKPVDFNPDIRQTAECPVNIMFPPWQATAKIPTTPIPRTPPMGYTGATGATGSIGDRGNVGSTGQKGFAGSKGATGERGPMGVIGEPGISGTKGDIGPQGPIGLKGLSGVSGFTGFSGSIGIPGPSGKNGTDAVYKDNQVDDGSLSPSQSSEWLWWRSKNLVIGLYAWSAILSTLVIAVLISSVVLMDRLRRGKNKSY